MSRASLFAGTFCLAVCIYVWVVIAFFLTENQFNPIQDALDDFFPKLEVFLQNNATFQGEKFNETTEDLRNYVENIRSFCPNAIIATLVVYVVYALSTLLMMIATEFQLNCVLMIPSMVLQLFFIIIMINISFLQSLTLALMSQYSSAFLLGSFIKVILLSWPIFLAIMVVIYDTNPKWALGIMCIVFLQLFYSSTATFAVVLNSIVLLHIPFAMCLNIVWKDFVSIKMEPKNTK